MDEQNEDQVVTPEETTETKEKTLKAKTVSLISKIVAGIILLGGSVLKWTGIFTNCEISELCTVAGTFVALFSTIDLNIALDKFTKKEN